MGWVRLREARKGTRDRRQPAAIDRPKLRRTIISVVEPTEMRDGDDIAGALLHQARRWRIPVESHVRTRLVQQTDSAMRIA